VPSSETATADVKREGKAGQLPRKPRHKQWGGAGFGLLAGIAGLVAGRLGHLYPQFDVFAQFGAQFVAMVIGFTVAIFMARFKTLIGMVLTLALLVAYGAWPHAVSANLNKGPFITSAGDQLLRVAHFNTYKNNLDFQAIANEVLRLDADVVSLVEMSRVKKQAILPLLKASYPHAYACEGVDHCDMAIVSKFPILSAEGKGHWLGAPYARVTLGGAMAGVTVYGLHTTRFPHSRYQLEQVQHMVKVFEQTPGNLVVMGDFNATPFSRVTRVLVENGNLSRITELPTWPANLELPQLSIDHIFISKNFRVAGNQQIGNAAGSDHYPILATLAFKPGQ
jgi:endonuclease/exonuclease/phosphatase (EEP) superfamily protein YafD